MLGLANTSENVLSTLMLVVASTTCFVTVFLLQAYVIHINLLEELKNLDESEMCVKKLQIIDFISIFNTVSFKLVHKAD